MTDLTVEQLQRRIVHLEAERIQIIAGQQAQANRLQKWRDAALWLKNRVDHQEQCDGYTAAYSDRYDCTCGLDSIREVIRGLLQ